MKASIVNVVATASLHQDIDFEEIRNFKDVFHDSDVYGGRVAYLKTPYMQGKVSIFSSGKMISVGTRSQESAYQELEAAKNYLLERGVIKDIYLVSKVRNLVVCGDFEKPINIENLVFKKHFIYEPEQFPGGILKLLKPCKATVLVFASGKFVIAGLKNIRDIEPTIKTVNELITDVRAKQFVRIACSHILAF